MTINSNNNLDAANPAGTQPPAAAKGYSLVSSVTTGAALPTAGAAGDITSIILTPGTWVVTGAIQVSGTTLVSTGVNAWTSATAGNFTTGQVFGDSATSSSVVPNAIAATILTIPPKVYSVSSNATIYLKVSATYSVLGDGASSGTIRAFCIA